jgi:hypothetical protein
MLEKSIDQKTWHRRMLQVTSTGLKKQHQRKLEAMSIAPKTWRRRTLVETTIGLKRQRQRMVRAG